ncbi:hypothetical protein HMPREF9136_2264 [Prevotella dentalis DSM 3688]|uniref:Uncharacterized protein n=1 Tax=Prevotella dentalis (strain ATCC 49559 / DSM 3688 / JCM 13448 / NCTC 12043 / ES 2772) TaxID=908937 RepID=F9D5Y6_PREDD|nr:hypothetical protein HMPREF9136_2264 [Prevotella dentalis DSM 3688]
MKILTARRQTYKKERWGKTIGFAPPFPIFLHPIVGIYAL